MGDQEYNSLHAGYFFMMFCCLQINFFSKVPSGTLPECQTLIIKDRRSVGPDLGPSGLEKSSADDEIDNQQVKG